MKSLLTALAMAMTVAGTTTSATAETKVTLKKMHICCGACVNGIKKAVKDLKGVSVDVSQKNKTTLITADTDANAQKAIDAIANAGYHAESDHKTLKVKDDSGASAGKVKRLEVTGVHNCCGGCNRAVKKAIDSVDGVKADTAKAKQDSFVVEGEFDALALIKALNREGFHVKVKK